MFIVGVTGRAGCGKDTFADRLMEKKPEFAKVSFADPIKSMLKHGLGLSKEQLYGDRKEEVDLRYDRTPRYLMQTLGTEWGRSLVGGDIWVQALENRLANTGPSNFVIPDVRFENEAELCRKHGVLVHIDGHAKPHVREHVSEKPVSRPVGDIYIDNNKDLQFFLLLCDSVIAYI